MNVFKKIGSKLVQYTTSKTPVRVSNPSNVTTKAPAKPSEPPIYSKEVKAAEQVNTANNGGLGSSNIDEKFAQLENWKTTLATEKKAAKAAQSISAPAFYSKDIEPSQWYKIVLEDSSYFVCWHNDRSYFIDGSGMCGLKYICLTVSNALGMIRTMTFEHLDKERFAAILTGKPTSKMLYQTYKLPDVFIRANDTKDMHPDIANITRAVPIF
ncbi:MAG: hypothetical protein WCO56_16290 [Verrucomicrobiota bacterium]